MPLESLLQLVETLRERIGDHRAALSQSETRTRYALIDPLLKELGWDTANPDMVVPEYSSGTGRADYALLTDGRPAMMIEAKKLGENLHDRARSQGVQYCIEEGTQYCSITDGARWEIYEPHRQVPIDHKRVGEFDLTGTSASEACLKALALWRPSVQSGVVAVDHETVITAVAEESVPPPQQTWPVDSSEDGWFPLLGLARELGSDPPRELAFPDSSRVPTRAWVSVMEETLRWLNDRGLLTAANCPIQRGRRNLVATRPEHPGGQTARFRRVNSLYFDRNFTGPDLVENARIIIRHAGLDPADFKVRFS